MARHKGHWYDTRKNAPPQGMIYFVMCEWFVKIGADGTEEQERWLHEQFKALHVRGEWFNFCEEMLTIKPPQITTASEVTVLLLNDLK